MANGLEGDALKEALAQDAAQKAAAQPKKCVVPNDHGEPCVRPEGHSGQHYSWYPPDGCSWEQADKIAALADKKPACGSDKVYWCSAAGCDKRAVWVCQDGAFCAEHADPREIGECATCADAGAGAMNREIAMLARQVVREVLLTIIQAPGTVEMMDVQVMQGLLNLAAKADAMGDRVLARRK